MICPTCHGEAETRMSDFPVEEGKLIPAVATTPCMHCLGTGEIPDPLTLEELLSF